MASVQNRRRSNDHDRAHPAIVAHGYRVRLGHVMARTMFQRAWSLIERAQREAKKLGHRFDNVAESIEVYDREAGDDEPQAAPIVLSESWNTIDEYDHAKGARVKVKGGDTFRNLERHLTALGCDCRYRESYEPCITCNGVIETTPQYWTWRPRFWFVDGDGYECASCASKDPSPYLDAMSDEYASTFPLHEVDLWGIEPSSHGWALVGSLDVRHVAESAEVQGKRIAKGLRSHGLDVLVIRREASYPLACTLDVYIRQQ